MLVLAAAVSAAYNLWGFSTYTTYQLGRTTVVAGSKITADGARIITEYSLRDGIIFLVRNFSSQSAAVNVGGVSPKFVYNLRMPGQYFDAETGLNYDNFRDYDPGTGRYVESDPIGLKVPDTDLWLIAGDGREAVSRT
jgi:RHS repeat-associated protein